jgi:sortase A
VAATATPPPPKLPELPTPVSSPTPAPTPAPYQYDPDTAGLEDRLAQARRSPPGQPVLLRIEKIGLETKVVEAGIGKDRRGNPIWETVPYVAAHYNVTADVGSKGNAVISGHVVTLYEGNVFRDLYKLDFGDRVEVSTLDSTFVYEVTDIKLVDPNQVEVMAPTPDPTLTLITCGGRFDRRTASFDQRLVVVGKLVAP